MNSLSTTTRFNPTQPTRRLLLQGLLTAYTASLIPFALAEPVDSPEQGAFLALSAIIAGRQSLDPVLTKMLYQALVEEDTGFAQSAKDLLALINQRQLDPLQLQKTLDDEKSPLATVPRKVATAWFMGVVGSGAKARCLAYEHALNAEIVADVLKPPTYAYGTYASWARNPTAHTPDAEVKNG
ncbi:MAG: sugar dehydrogenase complex small subunit [Pseudomonadota bacterium]